MVSAERRRRFPAKIVEVVEGRGGGAAMSLENAFCFQRGGHGGIGLFVSAEGLYPHGRHRLRASGCTRRPSGYGFPQFDWISSKRSLKGRPFDLRFAASGESTPLAECLGAAGECVDSVLMHEITQLLDAAAAGDRQAAAQILPLVYDELRILAAAKIAAEAQGHTLPNATALVHEAYASSLRLVGSKPEKTLGQSQPFLRRRAAPRRCAPVLVDRARHRRRQKRGGNLTVSEYRDDRAERDADAKLLALDEPPPAATCRRRSACREGRGAQTLRWARPRRDGCCVGNHRLSRPPEMDLCQSLVTCCGAERRLKSAAVKQCRQRRARRSSSRLRRRISLGKFGSSVSRNGAL